MYKIFTVPVELNSLKLETPLGNLTFNCEFNSHSLLNIPPIKQKALKNDVTISEWLFDECQIEFIRIYFDPKLPPGMRINKCLCGIWRIKVLLKNLDFRLECKLNSHLTSSLTGDRIEATAAIVHHMLITINEEIAFVKKKTLCVCSAIFAAPR